MRHFLTRDRLLEGPIPGSSSPERAGAVNSRPARTPATVPSVVSTLTICQCRRMEPPRGGSQQHKRRLGGGDVLYQARENGSCRPSEPSDVGSRSPPRSALQATNRPAACGTRLAAGVQAPSSPAGPAAAGASIGSRQTRDGGRRTIRRQESGPWRGSGGSSLLDQLAAAVVASGARRHRPDRHEPTRRAPPGARRHRSCSHMPQRLGPVFGSALTSRAAKPIRPAPSPPLAHAGTMAAGSWPRPLIPARVASSWVAMAASAITCGVSWSGNSSRKQA